MRQVIIREHRYPNSAEIIAFDESKHSASYVVEQWQKSSIHYKVHGTLPPVTWKVAESSSLVDALIESSKI